MTRKASQQAGGRGGRVRREAGFKPSFGRALVCLSQRLVWRAANPQLVARYALAELRVPRFARNRVSGLGRVASSPPPSSNFYMVVKGLR